MGMREQTRRITFLCVIAFGACALLAQTDPPPVAIKVEIVNAQAGKKPAAAKNAVDASNIVIWLTRLGPGTGTNASPAPSRPMPHIVQTNKSFDPHVLVVQTGAAVQFPNKDPFLHNVFSLFDGKRFDLGFYEAGSSKTVHFDRTGISFLFCNIHPEMSAAVVSVDTPYFGISDQSGRISIANVPDALFFGFTRSRFPETLLRGGLGWRLELLNTEQSHTRKPRIFLYTQSCHSHFQQQFHGFHMSADEQRHMPSARAQQPVFRLDQRDFVRREVQCFVAFDEIAALAQVPPLILVLGPHLMRRKRSPAGGDIFSAAEVDLAGGIEGRNRSDGQMNRESMNLILRMKNSRDVG